MIDVARGELCVVYYYNRKGRESLAYQAKAKDENEARRHAGGVFVSLNDKISFADVTQSAEVFWTGEENYEKLLPLALKIKKEYQKKRNTESIKRSLEKVKKEEKLIKVRKRRKKLKILDGQLSLLD